MKEKAEILIVDDHALILEGLCKVLGRIPEVVVANAVTTGREAIALIEERDYDIYIIDWIFFLPSGSNTGRNCCYPQCI